MKTKKYIETIALTAILALVATGCSRMIENNAAGGPIVFSADADYDNGPATRTIYSGTYMIGSVIKERINWVKNDPITIAYKQDGESTFQYGQYKIKDGTIQPSGAKSTASIEPVNDELYWGENSSKDHIFYALYPANGFGGNSKSSLTGADVTGTIPAVQVPVAQTANKYLPPMQYAGMVAMKRVGYAIPPSVNLQFRPAFTAFQFTINSDNSASITVSKFEMEATTNLTGDFAFTVTGSDADGAVWSPANTQVTNGGKKITVNFTTPVQINNVSLLDLTVLALPIDQTGVKITLTTSVGTKTLKLNDSSNNPVTFTARKKYLISNNTLPGGESWTYTVEDIDPITIYGHLAASVSSEPSLGFNVKSYKTNDQNATTAPVEWTVEYATNVNGPFYATPAAAGISDRFGVTTTTTDGGTTGESASAAILRDHDRNNSSEYSYYGSMDSEQAAIATLKNRTPLPTSTSDGSDSDGYYDLSKHPVYGTIDGPEEAMETANCYVITAPGKYKFPTVYGNAIRNGATNQMAYAPQGTSVTNDISYYMRRFLRHDNQPIAGPWIFDDNCGAVYGSCEAIVVWQDVSSAANQILLDEDISISSDGKYILFEIKKDRIRPGNICLALRYGSSTSSPILWSWHIWVTEKDLTPVRVDCTVADDHGVAYSDMMRYNLGWTDARDAGGYKWADWTFYVRIRQTETGGTQKVFAVNQIGDSETVDANVGSNTFYQWGRKDPILPAKSSDANKAYYSAQGYVLHSSPEKVTTLVVTGGFNPGEAIQHPQWMYHNSTRHHWIGSNNPCNLWDANLIALKNQGGGVTSNVIQFNKRFPLKTVYDPCPRGFTVPWPYAFTKFSTNPNFNHNGSINGNITNDGVEFQTGYSYTMFIPFCGSRGGDGETPIYDVKQLSYYWTSGTHPHDDDAVNGPYHAKHLYVNREGRLCYPFYGQYKEGAYSIRPILQRNYSE